MVLQWITGKMSNLFAITPMLFLVGLISFKTNPVSTGLTQYSQDEIFQGIFFAEGAFAERIPELNKFNARNYAKSESDLQQALDFQQKVLQKVKAKHPTYMASLQSAVLSGSHVKIQNAIYDGVKILDGIVWTIDTKVDQEVRNKLMADLSQKVGANTSSDQLKKVVDNYLDGISADDPILAKQACVAVLVVVVAVAVGVFLWVLYIVEASVERTPLANEQIINAIANMK